jgi:8-oxo-dGTP pyrophosphatase MutT (NUDIX family)
VTSDIPEWLNWVRGAEAVGPVSVLRRAAAAVIRPRDAAVLVLFGGTSAAAADVLLTQRATTLRDHSGQVAFPGGAADPGDDGPIGTALREAEEETGLDPAGVTPITTLTPIYVAPSRFDVTPVVAYWHTPSPVAVVNVGESQRVVRVPVKELIDPANRFQVRHPLGFQSPAFEVDGMLVWGFTGAILAGMLALSGWETEWDTTDIRDLAIAEAMAREG